MPSTPTNPFTEAFGSLAKDTMKKWKIPGMSFSAIHGDEQFSRAYGMADMETSKPVKADETLFCVGSTTKAQLCAAWAIYMDSEANKSKPKKDQISWSTSLAQIIPADFVLSDPVHTQLVTLEDILCHKSGMASQDGSYGWGDIKTPQAVTRNFRNLNLKTPVRTEWLYCNVGYAAATHALETVTGKELTDYLKEEVWTPLGMENTFGGIKDVRDRKQEARVSTGYTYSRYPVDEDWKQSSYTPNNPQDLSLASGAGYIISTAPDFLQWLRCLLTNSPPLSENIVKDLFTPRTAMPWSGPAIAPLEGGHVQYALGWIVGVFHGYKVLYHNGGCIGYGALVMVVPECKWAGVMFGNESYVGMRMNSLLFELFEISLGIPDEERKAFKKTDDAVSIKYKAMFPPREAKLKKLFPNAPTTPSIPIALPIASYAGTYFNTGRGPITLTKASDEDFLRCEVTDRTWPTSIKIHHINAEHWVFEQLDKFREMWKAESKVGVDGKVQGFGVALDGTGEENLVWYERQ